MIDDIGVSASLAKRGLDQRLANLYVLGDRAHDSTLDTMVTSSEVRVSSDECPCAPAVEHIIIQE